MLLNSKENLFKVTQHYFKSGSKEKAEFVDSICKELDLFRIAIRNSEYGFHCKNQSLTEDKKEDYENIIQADASMIYYCDEILKICAGLRLKVLSGDEVQPELLSVLNSLKIMKDIFQQRKDYVSGVAQILEIKEIK